MLDLNENKSILYSVFTEETACELIDFIASIYRKQADYKVMMARRMLNLSSVLLKLAEDKYAYQGIDSKRNPFISNTALLCAGKRIADYYFVNERFPEILICDDILVHGRGIMKLIRNLELIIKNSMLDYGIDVDEIKLRNDLSSSISVYVFCRNSDGILVDPLYRVYANTIVPVGELRKLSRKISYYLQRCGVANTSFVLSAQMPVGFLQKLYDVKAKYKTAYEDNSMLLYYRARNKSVFETIRINYYDDNSENGCVITSLPFFGDITIDAFDKLCNSISKVLEKNDDLQFRYITSALKNNKDEILIKPRAQLVTFIYSIVSLFEFCKVWEENQPRNLLKVLRSSDYEKVVCNFDGTGFMRYETYMFFKALCDESIYGDDLWACFEHIEINEVDEKMPASTYFCKGLIETVSGIEKTFDQAEDIFYSIGSTAEYDAVRSFSTGKGFKEEFIGYDIISFSKYLSLMRSTGANDIVSTGCILYLMDSGLLSMNVERTEKEGKVRSILKAGELAIYVLPRRFSVFLPALSMVEEGYSLKGNSRESVIGSFIDYLQEYCYLTNGKVDAKDLDLLRRLKDSKPLLLSIYSMGQTFKDWEICLEDGSLDKNDLKKPSKDKLADIDKLLKENHYLYYAFNYLYKATV